MKKIFTILCLMALTMGAQAQTHVTQTGQDYLNETQLKAGIEAATDGYYVALQIHAGSTFYVGGDGKAVSTFSTTGSTTWIIEKSGEKYVLKNWSGQYIKTLGGNGTAATFTTNSSEALKFNIAQSTSTDANMESGYVANKAIWYNVDGTNTRINTNSINGTQKTIWANSGTGCWTCLFTYSVSIKYNIVYKCYLEGESEPFQTVTSTDAYADGETVTVTDAMVPEFTGKTMTSHDASVTINGANAEVSVYYSEATTRNITYQVVDGNSSVLFTSEPITVNDGTTISTLPAEYQKTLFYDYNGGGTVTEDNQVITFTATVKSTAPFIPSTAASPVWYNLYIHPTDKHYPTYVANGNPNVTLPATLADDKTTQWAFIGNPYAGFQIINNAAGTSLILGSENAGNSDNNGGNTYATLNTAGTKTHETWTITASTHAEKGFYIANGQDYKLNYRSANNLAYWTNGFGAGSTFVATAVPASAYVIYEVVDAESDEVLFTSDARRVDLNSTITTLPTDLQRPAFYTYDEVNVAATDGATIQFRATLKENAPVQFTADATNPIYYNAKIRGKYLMYDSSVTDELKLQDTSEPFYHYAAWAFVGDPYKGFNVINQAKGANSVLTYTSVTTSKPANHNIQFQSGAEAEAKTWLIETNNNSTYPGGIVLRMKESTNIYFHHENSQNYLRTCSKEEWSNVHDDPGSTIILTTDKQALVDLYDLLNAREFGTGLNQYGKPENFDQVMAGANTVITGDDVAEFETQYNALKALQASLTLNMPQAKTFLRIKSVAQNGYVSSRTGVEVKPSLDGGTYANYYTTTGSATADSTIWFYDGTHLLNYKTGLYTNNCSAADLGSEGVTFAFSEAPGVLGNYNIKPAGSNYWYGGDPTLDNHSDNANANTRFTLEYVNELPITLRTTDNTNYFATFSAPVPVEISDAKLCSVSSNSNKWIQYEEKPATQLAADHGVLLHATGSGETTIQATATILTETEATDTYGLQAYSAAFTVGENDKTMLFLGKNSKGNAGFYALGSAKTNGFKAYFVNSTSGGEAKEGFDLVNANETTGVETIDNSQLTIDNAPVYNLQGQRVVKAQKGVFIQNGKKVVVK